MQCGVSTQREQSIVTLLEVSWFSFTLPSLPPSLLPSLRTCHLVGVSGGEVGQTLVGELEMATAMDVPQTPVQNNTHCTPQLQLRSSGKDIGKRERKREREANFKKQEHHCSILPRTNSGVVYMYLSKIKKILRFCFILYTTSNKKA